MAKRKDPQRTLSFDPEGDRSLSVLVTAAVADEKGVEVTDLEPLRTAIDINGVRAAIDAVQGNPDGSACISFSFEGYLVTVSSSGTIEFTQSP